MTLQREIEEDIHAWMNSFVAAPNAFYDGKFAPCPYARGAMTARTVDVAVWEAGDVRRFIRDEATGMRATQKIQTRVIVFPPRVQWSLGISEFVDTLNTELIAENVFLNTGVAKTTRSRYPGSGDRPYFMVVVNTLNEVLRGAKALRRTNFYDNWPAAHVALVVDRRASLASRYGKA